MKQTIDLMTGKEWAGPDQLPPLARNEFQERTAGVLAVAAFCLGTFSVGVPATRAESVTRQDVKYDKIDPIPQPRAPVSFALPSRRRAKLTR